MWFARFLFDNTTTMRRVFFITLFSLGVIACSKKAGDADTRNLNDLQEWIYPQYTLKGEQVWNEIRKNTADMPTGMYADPYTRQYYATKQPLVWLTREGISLQADTLLTFLSKVDEEGFSTNCFQLDSIQELLRRARELDFERNDANKVLGKLEFLLTQAYLRYACGQRFGYIHPRHIFNNLLVDPPAEGEKRTYVIYRQLYDHGSEEVTDSFVHHAIEQARTHCISGFLLDIQPTDTIFRQIKTDYQRARQQGDTARTRLARINMERARWRYPHPNKGKYIFVNLAEQELTAMDTDCDTALTMRVCCGNSTHKTPLLHSEVKYVELNPYWVIPQTIVRKEIVPRHVGDSAYFARNNYHAFHKGTKEEVDPTLLTSAELRSAQYTLRQEKGVGNSLGRIIFRFPNNFSVYLHDTNNQGAFQKSDRAISHGCVRVQKPLDLLLFLLDNPTAFYIDRIRMSIDLPPLTPAGRIYQQNHPDTKPLSSIGLSSSIPVWLDYWTLYPNTNGTLSIHPDKYGYDEVIEKALNAF